MRIDVQFRLSSTVVVVVVVVAVAVVVVAVLLVGETTGGKCTRFQIEY
jgi:hypothetical protein